jgi:hypothetical protein
VSGSKLDQSGAEPGRPSQPAPAGRDQGAYPPIADYALLSDCHSAALVSRDGSVDWCCFHRFDARPVFARLLDWANGGHFRIAPAGPYTVSRRYLPATNVLETRYLTQGGVLTVVDCLAIRRGPAAGDAAQTRSHHQLLRLVGCEAGQVEDPPEQVGFAHAVGPAGPGDPAAVDGDVGPGGGVGRPLHAAQQLAAAAGPALAVPGLAPHLDPAGPGREHPAGGHVLLLGRPQQPDGLLLGEDQLHGSLQGLGDGPHCHRMAGGPG